MRVVHLQSVVVRVARCSVSLVDIAEFRMGTEQLPLSNRGQIEAAAARGDFAEERVRYLSEQGAPHRQELWIQLIEI